MFVSHQCNRSKANSRPVKHQFAQSWIGIAIVTGASLALNNTKLSGESELMTGSHNFWTCQKATNHYSSVVHHSTFFFQFLFFRVKWDSLFGIA